MPATLSHREVEADSATPDGPFADGALTVRAAVEWSGLGRTVLFELMRAGRVPFVKSGTRRLIPRRALQAYLDTLTNETGSEGNSGLHWQPKPAARPGRPANRKPRR